MGAQFIWPSIGRTAVGENIGRLPLARRFGGSAQLGSLGLLRQAQLFLISVRRGHLKWLDGKPSLAPMWLKRKGKC